MAELTLEGFAQTPQQQSNIVAERPYVYAHVSPAWMHEVEIV